MEYEELAERMIMPGTKSDRINWWKLKDIVRRAEKGVEPRKPIPRRVREEVLKRDGACVVCGRKEHLHVHHVNPRGESSPENLVVLCKFCHQAVHCLLHVTGKHKFVHCLVNVAKLKG